MVWCGVVWCGGSVIAKHRENSKTLPFEILFGCQYVKVVFTTVTITTVIITFLFGVYLEFLSFANTTLKCCKNFLKKINCRKVAFHLKNFT